MPSSHLTLCRPLLLLPPIPPSIKVFSNESTLRTRWPKYWSFSFSIIPSKEIPGLISFRMDWSDLLAVQVQGAAPQKERGSRTSLSKAEGSRGEVSLLSANPASHPQRARDNQTRQVFPLSSSALLPQTLGLYRQARGFCEGLSIVAPITLKVKL